MFTEFNEGNTLNWKTMFKSMKSSDMRNRVLAVLGIIVIYRFLSHIPVPLAEPTQLKDIVTNTSIAVVLADS